MKSPYQRPTRARYRRHNQRLDGLKKEHLPMHRLAWSLIGAAALLLGALIALLLSDALAPGRLPPRLGVWGAGGAGLLLVAGLRLLERRPRAPKPPRHALPAGLAWRA
jgi:hypothetical protein